jgi:CheY-like chemotaxis protein
MSYFQAWGLRSELSVTVAEAHERVERANAAGDPFRLVLLDCPTVEMSGLALASEVRAHPLLEQMPLILLNSADRRRASAELQTLAPRAVIKKPIHPDELRSAVLGALAPCTEQAKGRTLSPGTRSPLPWQKEESVPSPLRLLVAEDNVVNQRVVQLQLKKLGYVGKLVNNGAEALVALRSTPYDIVLMDCQMPEMDGYQLTQIIKEDPGFSKLHIIAMTANAMQGDREKCLAVGMDDYVTKPLRLEDLRAALARAQDALTESQVG